MTRRRQTIALVLFLALAFSAALLGSLFTVPATMDGGWYDTLYRPSWAPPDWLFGPVWTLLYTLMGIAAWLVWRERGSWRAARAPLALFVMQLLLNASWSVVFFGQHLPTVAFIVIVVLWLLILATMLAFWRVRALAGWLFLPYLLWVTFASALNYTIARHAGM